MSVGRERRLLELVDRPCPVCGEERARAEVARGVDWEYGSCANSFTFVECARCAVLYLNPRPAPEDFDVIYPPDYYSRAEASGEGGAGPLVRLAWQLVERRRAAPLRELVGGREAAAVLDVGCGDGRLLRALRRAGGRRWDLTGVERGLGAGVIERARAEEITLLEGAYEQAELGEGRFDLVIAQQVLEHVLEPAAVLEKMRRELRPGGFVVLDTPNVEGLDRRLFARGLWGGYHFPRHLTLFTPETLATLACRIGLEVWQVRPLLSPVFWIMTLHNAAAAAGLPRAVTRRLTYRSAALLGLSTLLELPLLAWSGRTSNMRVLLRRAPEAG